MSAFVDAVAYWLAAAILAVFPPVVLYWLLVHTLTRFWRRLGVVATFSILAAVCLPLAGWILLAHDRLLATPLPFRWWRLALGLVLAAAAAWLARASRGELAFPVLAGVPEVDARGGQLLTRGIYARSRNPRYLGILLGLFGWAFILRFEALFWLAGAMIPALYVVILLEERELAARFGEEYARYRERVPRLVPGKRT